MSNTGARFYTIVLLVLISLTFFLIGLYGVNKASDPAYEDTLNFLELALFIKDNGGVFNFLNLCLSGQYKAVIQHPLYPLLLSTFASREPIFFEQAKLLSLVIGLMVVIAFFYITKDLYGDTVASVASTLLIFNTTFLRMSIHVACEALLIFFILLSVYWIVKGLDNNIYWVWAGAAGGLAYMTKGTGLLLIPIVVIVTLLVFGAKVVRNRRLWLFFALFLIICSPLIVRNIVVYSDPLYEDGTNNSLWLDSWYSIYDAKYGVAVRFPEVTWEARYLPTMQSYLQTHSLSEIINRFTNGIRGEARLLFHIPDSLLVPIGKQYFRLLMVLFFCVGLIVETDRRRTLCALMTMATFFIPFAWFNPVVPGIRYIAPLIPLVCIYSAMGVTGALEHFDKEVLAKFGIGSSVKWIPAVLMVLLVLILGYVTMTKQVNLPSASIALSEDRQELSAWIGKNVKHDDLIVSDNRSHFWAYMWLAGLKGKSAEWIDGSKPSIRGGITSINQLNAFLKSIPVRNETYVIILVDAILSPSLLTNYFEYNEVNGIIETRHIDGWNLVYRHSKKPATFLIYQIDKQ